MIELHNICKTFRVAHRPPGLLGSLGSLFHRKYKEVRAVDHVSFTVNRGEIVGFIGPNGAGKSTTIKIMTGILVPDSGECRILGRTPWNDRIPHVKDIGVVFGQRTQLWWDVPVRDSYNLLRDIYDIPEKRYQHTLSELVEIMKLEKLLDTPLRQLSLGQRMGCEIVASLLHEPEVLFLDEPTIGLDAVSKLAVRRFIARLNRERRITVVLTTHDMDDIGALTDRILLIGRGKLLYDGSMRAIRREYDTQRILNLTFSPCLTPVEIPGATLVSWEDEHARYKINLEQTDVSRVLTALGDKLSILDLTVESRQLEEIIARLYREHKV